MKRYPCPYLSSDVELSKERTRRIAERHPDLLPAHAERIAQVLREPDLVRRSSRLRDARLFSRSVPGRASEKHVVVVVVSEVEPLARHWVVTAYQARKLSGGEIEWERN